MRIMLDRRPGWQDITQFEYDKKLQDDSWLTSQGAQRNVSRWMRGAKRKLGSVVVGGSSGSRLKQSRLRERPGAVFPALM